MAGRFKDYEHLIRMAGLFVIGITVFLVVRAALIPDDFGELGHYRTGAIEDNRNQDLIFAGWQACVECHDDMAETRQQGAHAKVGCEACHGAMGAHAADPGAQEVQRPEALELCAGCHENSVARPSWFPQVDTADHSDGDACSECHEPHDPGLE